MVNTTVKQKRILTPEYWKWYLEMKQKGKLYHGLVKSGFYNHTVHSVFENDLDLWCDQLLNNEIPGHIEVNIRAGKKRLGKSLPLKFERSKK